MKPGNIIYSVVHNRCPRCHQGKVFAKDNPYHLNQLFNMNAECDHCNERYEKEPGYFYGSMFVSYAFTSLLFLLIYISDLLFFKLGTDLLYFLIPGVVILSPLTFHWSRLIWLNFFIKFNPDFVKKTD